MCVGARKRSLKRGNAARLKKGKDFAPWGREKFVTDLSGCPGTWCRRWLIFQEAEWCKNFRIPWLVCHNDLWAALPRENGYHKEPGTGKPGRNGMRGSLRMNPWEARWGRERTLYLLLWTHAFIPFNPSAGIIANIGDHFCLEKLTRVPAGLSSTQRHFWWAQAPEAHLRSAVWGLAFLSKRLLLGNREDGRWFCL